jgi:hypothetical protein
LEEFHPLAQIMGMPWQAVQNWWGQIDLNRDGFLDYMEFLRFCNAPTIAPRITQIEACMASFGAQASAPAPSPLTPEGSSHVGDLTPSQERDLRARLARLEAKHAELQQQHEKSVSDSKTLENALTELKAATQNYNRITADLESIRAEKLALEAKSSQVDIRLFISFSFIFSFFKFCYDYYILFNCELID